MEPYEVLLVIVTSENFISDSTPVILIKSLFVKQFEIVIFSISKLFPCSLDSNNIKNHFYHQYMKYFQIYNFLRIMNDKQG